MNTECFQGNTTNPGLLRIANRLFDAIRASIGAICLIPAIAAAEFQIDWGAFGGPAGKSTNGSWTVASAPGAGAGIASGGPFSLTGGYWAVVGTVPAPTAPRLTIERIGHSVRAFWPRSAEAFILEETSTLTGSPGILWTTSAYPRETNLTQISVTVAMPVGTRYFRLNKR